MDNVFELFRRVADNNYDIAIETATQSISYANLLQKSLQYYQYISTINTSRIAIQCDVMSIDIIAMMLAILAANKSCLLIDMQRNSVFNDKIINTLGIEYIFTNQDLIALSNQTNINIDIQIAINNVSEKDEGYIITTSGSTGEPKIILGSHAGLSHFIIWQKNHYFQQDKYRVAQTTNCAFDVIYREILTTLIAGSTLVIPEIDLKYQSGEKMYEWLIANRIDVLYMVPSICDFWLSTIAAKKDTIPIAKVFFAGEKLQKTTIKKLQQYFDIETIANFYGPSETTLAKFYYDIDIANIDEFDIIAVGKPLPDTQAVLDEEGQILINTKYPSLGYLSGDSFIWRDGKKYYPTGDIGEIKNNLLFVYGRMDDQVKVNGVRVHLNDINTHIQNIAGVVESIVLQDDKHKIVAFYTGLAEQSFVYNELNKVLYQQIMPSAIYHVQNMPRTVSAKIDRRALINQLTAKNHIQENDFLYDTWRKVTGYQGAITEQDSFFQLGGDSLDIAYFVIELERIVHKKIDYWSLYENPIIQDFRAWLEQ